MLEIFGMTSGASKPAAIGALGAIGGGLYAAVVSPDVVPVIGGIGIGIIGIGWSVYAAGRDRRAITLTSEIEVLQGIIKSRDQRIANCEVELFECQRVRRQLREEVEVLGAKLAVMAEKSGEHGPVSH